ncbi:BREX-1 system phosphatase PglZ type A [Luteimicrobium subarcticum]|uniref:Uncharacterized protein (TIGR02687 family) n=1 Tax=Luteimicrobium subarcticum TaxID=620910 RepID=A0A2M8WRP8_9MICO|nr:BREX-1 system phosphatase PglZ type A [Luteimicrobium subarcticum]PJI93564.1 uncharacterized protein (TIGR02687 family) [Luteimicrobium subarcticum]
MSDLGALQSALVERFKSGKRAGSRHVAFWHDLNGEYASNLDALAAGVGDVKVIRVDGDEYAVKHRLLTEEPDQAFIVYRTGEIPDGVGNWLLDLELAYGVFTADRAALVSQDLGVPENLMPVVAEHEKFFNSVDRSQRLKKLLDPDDDRTKLRAKMSAVLLKTGEHAMRELTRALIIENAQGSTTGFDSLVDQGLADFHWRGSAEIYGYDSSDPSIDDFVIWVFQNAREGFVAANRNLELDFASWRNEYRSREAMATLARRVENDLQVSASYQSVDFHELLDSDTFEVIDRKIITDLARGVSEQTLSLRDVTEAERARQGTFWYQLDEACERLRPLYTAIRTAAELLDRIEHMSVATSSFDDGLAKYTGGWFKIDQLYRQFLYAARRTNSPAPLDPLLTKIEGFYTNKFVIPLATEWQKQVDAATAWKSATFRSQQAFYASHIAPLVAQSKRAVVVISDALRYEVADELASRIRQENKLGASTDAMLGVVPSYTQLGMAALLPHSTLAFAEVPKKSAVLVDGQPANGTASRAKILAAAAGGTAVVSDDIATKTVHELRSWLKDYSVVYVYHDVIDGRSHKLGSESGTPKAAADAIDDLVTLVKRLNSADAGRIFVTADHGFLFQEKTVEDSDFLPEPPSGETEFRDRRFLLGRDFAESDAFVTYSPEQLGLAGSWQVHIPKSVYRLRLQGAADRFVHGGTTLQEVVVPVVTVTKSGRTDDVRKVEIQIRPKTPTITGANLVVDLFQADAVSDKVQPREVRAGVFYDETLISDHVTLVFNSDSAEARERFQQAKLKLSPESDSFNNKQVELRLEELIPNTTQWVVIPGGRAQFTIRRSFSLDF